MAIALITGSGGLIGSESTKFFHEQGFDVVGVDNDSRSYFFGEAASTKWKVAELGKSLSRYKHHNLDIRDQVGIDKLFKDLASQIKVIIHTAAQPSHDWAAREPFTDFTINANGTLNLLEATRKHCPSTPFIFTSTNKVYGDTPNFLPLVEKETRWEIAENHQYFKHGIDESMSIDQSKHSIFGASKVAADVLVQEYGRYFNMNTVTFRGGCLTGPSHSGAELHGFLAYLVKCALTGTPYKIFGYKGKQVRDNIHSYDLVQAFWHYVQKPKPAAVYNMGGSRHSHCSMIEAINEIERISSKRLSYTLVDENRSGDHIWYVSDVRAFQKDYPGWNFKYNLTQTLEEMIDAMKGRYS